ncbi:MAG TPA: methyltransferase [bacterium]|nr:methyltransferase [bacterium]
MKNILTALTRIAFFILVIYFWSWMLPLRLSNRANISIIIGGILMIFPIAWLGRRILDNKPTASRAVWVNTMVHYAIVILAGAAVVRALTTHQDWPGWSLPVPLGIGLLLVIVTSGATLLTVITLAVKGLGAPFAVALSRKLAVDWLYAWTRNPMVLAVLSLGLALGLWFRSLLFVLWVLILFAPALLFFVKTYEERELEIRFGVSYLEYNSRTPMLLPKKPKG